MSKVKLILFRFGSTEPLARDFASMYEHNPKFDHVEINEVAQGIKTLEESGNGIFIFKVNNKEDLQNAIMVLKSQKKLVRKGLFKSVGLLPKINPKVEKILGKYGCKDIFDTNMNTKALSYKVEFWSKPIITQLEKLENEMAFRQRSKEAVIKKPSEAGSKDDFQWITALDLESDIWLVKNQAECKKVLRRWLMKIKGPSNKIGNWEEVPAQPGDKHQTWKFVLADSADDRFISDDGAWFFYGSKPEFDWKAKLWTFASDSPHLYFYARSGEVYSRFKYKEGQVHITKNSDVANFKEELIDETLEGEFHVAGSADIGAGHMVGEGSTEDLGGELAGESDGSSSSDQSGNLSGKGGAADRYGEEALAGKGGTDSYGESPIGGKGSTDSYGDEALAGKAATDSYGDAPIGGKSSTDIYGDEALAGKAGIDSFGEDPIGGKGGASDSFGDDPLQGKAGSSDSYGDEAVGGKGNEADSFDDLSGEIGGADSYGDDPLAGEGSAADSFGDEPLYGKAKQDRYGDNPLDGEGSAADIYGEEALSGKGGASDSFGDEPLYGKAKPDSIGDEPLYGKAKPDSIGDELSGDGSAADEYGKDPLSGKGGASDSFGDEPLYGKAKPDSVGAEFSGEGSAADEYGKDPLSGKGGAANSFGEDPLGGEGSAADSFGENPLAGKTNTDEYGKDPLGGEGSAADSFGENPLAGKTNTDEYGKDPLGGEGSAADSFGENPLAGSIDGEASGVVNPAPGSIDGEASGVVNPAANLDGVEATLADIHAAEGTIENSSELEEENKVPKVIDNKAVEEKDDSFEHNHDEINKDVNKEQNVDYGDDISLAKPQSAFDLAKEKRDDAREHQPSTRTSMNNGVTDTQANASGAVGRDNSNSLEHRDQKASEMEDILGGSHTDGSTFEPTQTDPSLVVAEDEIPEDDEIPNIEDVSLESGELKVILNQKTDSGNTISFICEFTDFYEEELVVKSPNGTLKEGDSVEASVILSYNGRNINVECAGTIIEVDANDDELTQILSIELENVDPKKYESFMTLYQDRQESITDFLKIAKGY